MHDPWKEMPNLVGGCNMSVSLLVTRILGLYGDNGKENGNHCSMLGLYGDNGKENGN